MFQICALGLVLFGKHALILQIINAALFLLCFKDHTPILYRYRILMTFTIRNKSVHVQNKKNFSFSSLQFRV